MKLRNAEIFADKEANELATQLLSKIENEFVHSSFVTSFCDDGDLLGQWRGYGGGVSIAFDAKALNAACGAQTTLVKVMYEPEGQVEILDSMIISGSSWLSAKKGEKDFEFFKDEILKRLQVYFENISAQMKNASFRDEREWRLLTTRPLGDLNAPPEVHFRAREKAISPYVELNPVNGKLPIRGIILSPNCHSTASACFEAMLAKHGYEDAFVNFSEIPYRD